MRAEDGVAHKTLLLLMVRLIHADPMLLLNVKINNDHVYAGDVVRHLILFDFNSSRHSDLHAFLITFRKRLKWRMTYEAQRSS